MELADVTDDHFDYREHHSVYNFADRRRPGIRNPRTTEPARFPRLGLAVVYFNVRAFRHPPHSIQHVCVVLFR